MSTFWQRGGTGWCVVAFLLLGMAPGFWVPAVSTILEARGDTWLVPWAFLPSCVGAILAPLGIGALADQRFNAEKVLAAIALGGAIFLWLAFRSLAWGWSGWWFIAFMMTASLISAPMWSLLSTIVMRPMSAPESTFPLVRLAGTIGWIISGFAVGYWLQLEGSPDVGNWAACVRVGLAAVCLLLPATPPAGNAIGRTWSERLGLGALTLMRDRDQRVFFLTTALLSIPLAAFYAYTPMHLVALGDRTPTATMAYGQLSEIVAMLLVAVAMRRFRVKWLLLGALVLAVLRYALFALDVWPAVLVGVLLHGIIYTAFFITGQVFMERRCPREMRAQAQALLSVMSAGVGGIFGYSLGYLGLLWVQNGGTWQLFWTVQMVICIAVMAYFALRYRGESETSA